MSSRVWSKSKSKHYLYTEVIISRDIRVSFGISRTAMYNIWTTDQVAEKNKKKTDQKRIKSCGLEYKL